MREKRDRLSRSLLLALAATSTIWPAVDALLQQDVDAWSTEPDGTTALHWAARPDAFDIEE